MNRPFAEVIGDPIAQSKSPLIHNFWLAKLGIDAEYRACHVRPAELPGYFVRRSTDPLWRGCNVTMPHKRAVQENLGRIDRLAAQVGAVNTVLSPDASLAASNGLQVLVPQHGGLEGFNTDVAGILAALPHELMPPGAKVCILGSGGAARAALAACRERQVALVLMSVRNQELGRALLQEFCMEGVVRPIEDAQNIQTAEVIINATPLGMTGASPMPAQILEHIRAHRPDAIAFDMVYSPLETDLLKAAANSGCGTVDGLAMLVGQAAAAFKMFFGQPAPREHDAELRERISR